MGEKETISWERNGTAPAESRIVILDTSSNKREGLSSQSKRKEKSNVPGVKKKARNQKNKSD